MTERVHRGDRVSFTVPGVRKLRYEGEVRMIQGGSAFVRYLLRNGTPKSNWFVMEGLVVIPRFGSRPGTR